MAKSRIDSFSGAYGFLSNFFIEPDGSHVEGEYQAKKCQNSIDRKLFRGLVPWEAKRLGRHIKLRKDWERVKIVIMYELVKEKFRDPALAELLLATGNAELIEGNTHGDRFWGQVDGRGENHLGKILMRIRDELRFEL